MQAARSSVEISERHACGLVLMVRSSFRYQASPRADDETLRARLYDLAMERRRFGYRRLHALLRREGCMVNHKRVYRLYVEDHLCVRQRRSKHRVAMERLPLTAATFARQSWSVDFVSDALATGRRFRTLNVVDDYTREAMAIEVDTSLSGARVTRVLDKLRMECGLPQQIRSDNGPEFVSRAVEQWSYESGVKWRFIEPGRPMQNGYVESFNSRFRDECLNENWFTTLADARVSIEQWRQDYNHARPHSSLGYRTPTEFRIAGDAGSARLACDTAVQPALSLTMAGS